MSVIASCSSTNALHGVGNSVSTGYRQCSFLLNARKSPQLEMHPHCHSSGITFAIRSRRWVLEAQTETTNQSFSQPREEFTRSLIVNSCYFCGKRAQVSLLENLFLMNGSGEAFKREGNYTESIKTRIVKPLLEEESFVVFASLSRIHDMLWWIWDSHHDRQRDSCFLKSIIDLS